MKNNIAIFRKELGMTQKQLAHAIGMSVEDLNAIENNTLEPTLIDANLKFMSFPSVDTAFILAFFKYPST